MTPPKTRSLRSLLSVLGGVTGPSSSFDTATGTCEGQLLEPSLELPGDESVCSVKDPRPVHEASEILESGESFAGRGRGSLVRAAS